MNYTKRALWIHLGLFLLAFLAFILPVIIGTTALLPLWLSGGLSILLAAGALIDAAFKFFAPASPRSLKLLSSIAASVLLVGWVIWFYIYGNMAAVGTGTYRIGNFLLSVGCVLNLFIIAISVLDIRRLARQ